MSSCRHVLFINDFLLHITKLLRQTRQMCQRGDRPGLTLTAIYRQRHLGLPYMVQCSGRIIVHEY